MNSEEAKKSKCSTSDESKNKVINKKKGYFQQNKTEKNKINSAKKEPASKSVSTLQEINKNCGCESCCQQNSKRKVFSAQFTVCPPCPRQYVSTYTKPDEVHLHTTRDIPLNNFQENYDPSYACPCFSKIPPPPAPNITNDNLWEPQFCRWWGWNWVRKHEELLNHQKSQYSKHSEEFEKKQREQEDKDRQQKKQGGFKNFCLMCKNYYAKNKKKQYRIDSDKKKDMQKRFDTPCSSVMFCGCQNSESRSIIFEGNMECSYNRKGCRRSLSTIYVQKLCRCGERKTHSWCRGRAETSSSDECCPCSRHRKSGYESSTQASVEYMSVKSESEECCYLFDHCCPCNHKVICCCCGRNMRRYNDKRNEVQDKSKLKRIERGTEARNMPCKCATTQTKSVSKHQNKCCHCKNRSKRITYCLCQPQQYICCPCKVKMAAVKNGRRSSSDSNLNQRSSCKMEWKKRGPVTLVKSKSTQYFTKTKDKATICEYNVWTESRPVAGCFPSKSVEASFKLLTPKVFHSPVSGHHYNLDSVKVETQRTDFKKKLPKTLDKDANLDGLFMPFVTYNDGDQEHKELLMEVCEALLNSRKTRENANGPTIFENRPCCTALKSQTTLFTCESNKNCNITNSMTSEVDPVFKTQGNFELNSSAPFKPNDDSSGFDGKNSKVKKKDFKVYTLYKTCVDCRNLNQTLMQPPNAARASSSPRAEETTQTSDAFFIARLDTFEKASERACNEGVQGENSENVSLSKPDIFKWKYHIPVTSNVATSIDMILPTFSENILSCIKFRPHTADAAVNTSFLDGTGIPVPAGILPRVIPPELFQRPSVGILSTSQKSNYTDFAILPTSPSEKSSQLTNRVSFLSSNSEELLKIAAQSPPPLPPKVSAQNEALPSSPKTEHYDYDRARDKEKLMRKFKDYETHRRISERDSPFSMFCPSVTNKNFVHSKTHSSIPRPERKVVLEKVKRFKTE